MKKIIPILLLGLINPAFGNNDAPVGCPLDLPGANVTFNHIEHDDILNGNVSIDEARINGGFLFDNEFNACDGQGRPATTSTGEKRSPPSPLNFDRVGAPDANGCVNCHNTLKTGGSSPFNGNAFTMAQEDTSIPPEGSNLRNPPALFGSGPIELLAREMSRNLQKEAKTLGDGDHILKTHGVEFKVTIENGEVIASEGIDTDLIIKPFTASGTVTSIRQFTNGALNQHFGMQSEEEFDLNPEKGVDFDEDGFEREITIGDVTSMVLWVAGLPQPIQGDKTHDAEKGEKAFKKIGCSSCHIPKFKLKSLDFTEPNEFNPNGCTPDWCPEVTLALNSHNNHIRPFTDLKRHNMCDPEDETGSVRYYCNEVLNGDRPDQNGIPGTDFFLTAKLWHVADTAPYGHRGDLTTLTEAILAHGGEARDARIKFQNLPEYKQIDIIKFLETLHIP